MGTTARQAVGACVSASVPIASVQVRVERVRLATTAFEGAEAAPP